jgi:hypothetical protein
LPARASTTTVNTRPSSGSVAAPIAHDPHADDTAASSGSSSLTPRRVNPHRGGVPAVR